MINKYNNTCHSVIKMKPINLKNSTYIDYGIENNYEDPKFEIDDHVRIWKPFCKRLNSKLF